MNTSKYFTDLIVWQKAHAFVLGVYNYTNNFPKSELYGLTQQFRRAAVSIPANIAEGYRRRTQAEKMRFLNISQSSLEECRNYVILAQDLDYGPSQSLEVNLNEVARLLNGYINGIIKKGVRR